MNEIQKTNNLVKDILIESEAARNSDMFLYLKVCERVSPEALQQPFHVVISSLKNLNLPPFETVRRTRQKIQADFPELASCKRVEKMKAVKEEAFREYARG